jgi:hypothetical protein
MTTGPVGAPTNQCNYNIRSDASHPQDFTSEVLEPFSTLGIRKAPEVPEAASDDATDLATALTLLNELKGIVNGILQVMKVEGYMDSAAPIGPR